MKKQQLILILSFFIYGLSFPQTAAIQFLKRIDVKWAVNNVGPGTFTDCPQFATIGLDGTVYVNTKQSYLVALNPVDGSELWDLSGHYYPPSIGTDGTLFSGSSSDVVAINPDGSELWRLSLGIDISTMPALSANGTVYLCAGQFLIAVDPDAHSELWRIDTGEDIACAPSVGHDGTVYVASGSDLIAINPSTQMELWRFGMDDPITTSASLGDSGMIYVGANSQLYSIRPDGTEEWKLKTGAYINAAPAIGSDGTIYLPVCFLSPGYSGYGLLLAIHPEGYQRWRFKTDYYNLSTPTLGADGTIFLASAGSLGLVAIDPYGNEKWHHPAFGNARWSPPIAPDGTLYFSASFGTFTALETNSGGPANSPWPMEGHDAQHTGRNDDFIASCPGPRITQEPENQLVESDNTATLTVGVNGQEPLNYQWYEGFTGDKTNPVGSEVSFTTPVLTESKQYWVEISNECGFTFSRAATIALGSDGQIKWFFEANEEVLTSPAIADDGTIYFGTENATLYAINPYGNENWQFQAHYTPTVGIVGSVENWIVRSDPTVGPNGTIYFGSGALYDPAGEIDQVVVGILWALYPDGSEKWRHIIDESADDWPAIYSSPALGLDGTLYVVDQRANLYAINGDGSRKWRFENEVDYESSSSSPCIGLDGTIYYSTGWYDGPNYTFYKRLYAVNPDGTKKWHYQFDNANGYYANPAIGADGTLFLPGPNEHFLALNPNGTVKWQFYTGALCSNAAIGADGTIYFGSGQDLGHLYAVNPINGEQLWKSAALYGATLYFTAPVVGADGIIYIRMGDRLYAMNPAGGSEKWNNASIGEGSYSSPVIGPDGTLYLGRGRGSTSINNGYLWAMTTASLGLADSPWPVIGQNNAHWQRDPEATINCDDPAITSQPLDQSITSGHQATISVSATGTALLYQWYKGSSGDMETPVDTGAILVTEALDQDAYYWVQVSNACGIENSQTVLVTVVSGVWDVTDDKNPLLLFPNPSGSVVSLQSAVCSRQPAIVEVYDLSGRKLLEKYIPAGNETTEIDVSALESGMYLLKLQTEDGFGVRKIIIQ